MTYFAKLIKQPARVQVHLRVRDQVRDQASDQVYRQVTDQVHLRVRDQVSHVPPQVLRRVERTHFAQLINWWIK